MKKKEVAGVGAGVAANSGVYSENVILNAKRGHGFAAEKANHLKDLFSGKDAEIIGGDNARNGADRLVDGINIQTKYCNSASKSIQECFENGRFRYLNADGSPMQIEVPSDQYDGAVRSMEVRIRRGQVPGVSDPAQAKFIVRKGGFSYQQARNIAKFGTIESITYDAVKGVQIAGTAMSLTAAITFACAMWSGEELEVALKQACTSGLKVGGVTWISSILMAQLGRTGLEQSLRPATDFAVKQLGPKAAAWFSNGLRGGGKAIHGAAAMNSASKLLRGNVVTGIVTTALLSSVDLARLVDGKISGSQFTKNLTHTGASVAEGAGGYAVGAGIGTAMLPGVGTLLGGLIGGAIAGCASSAVSRKVLDQFIEDDAVAMGKILENELKNLAIDYLLLKDDIEKIVDNLQHQSLAKRLREMYAASDSTQYAKLWLTTLVEEVVQQRAPICLPADEAVTLGYEEACLELLAESC